VLALVVCALVVSAALPLREYIAQRSAIDQLLVAQTAQRARIAALEIQRRQLQDPSYLAALARQRLHFVKPGETAYVLLAPSAGPSVAGSAGGVSQPGPVGAEAPWYAQIWGSVRTADRPVGVAQDKRRPGPTPAPQPNQP
jgi:hypothetical protein